MDNYAIADQLSLLAKLMDIHGENSFKSKSYSAAAFTLEKLPGEINSFSKEKIFSVRGIGESVGKNIIEIIETGSMQQLQELIKKTPEGVLEMMNIKGLGPKKINLLWKELGIETIDDLQEACNENIIASQKGFGEKTQNKIVESIQFQHEAKGKYHYAKTEAFAEAFNQKLKIALPEKRFEMTGAFRRQLEIIETLDWVTTATSAELKKELVTAQMQLVTDRDGMLILNAENALLLRFFISDQKHFATALFETSCSDDFLNEWKSNFQTNTEAKNEEEIFASAGLNFIPAFVRETKEVLHKPFSSTHKFVEVSSIKGLIHSHSNWSDGSNTIDEMAEALIGLGFEYLVLSDHSKAAYYATGLHEEKIKQQHQYIDALSKKLAPFKIFKSIECDILSDGKLDYDDSVLSTFDLVITSIHSNLDMPEEKAMKRLLGAITNPYTTIMGHLTGRLLLKRNGYPVDHKTIIDACAENNVAIEINANPKRLDMDWRWIEYALKKNVLLSINPDAHTIEEFHNIKYGVLVAQKGGLTADKNISSFSLKQFEFFLNETKKKKGI
ncbi:MAG: helix-hairpin-helix domain-containing protein [Bacteroidota bacterium]